MKQLVLAEQSVFILNSSKHIPKMPFSQVNTNTLSANERNVVKIELNRCGTKW